MLILDATTGTAGSGGEMMGSVASLALLVLMFVVFYFILIRPQKKKDKELKEQMSKLAVGDKVITIGGLVGFVANIKDDQITILDYKTDREKTEEELKSKYKIQMKLYREAVFRIIGCRDIRTVLYSFALHREIFVEEGGI